MDDQVQADPAIAKVSGILAKNTATRSDYYDHVDRVLSGNAGKQVGKINPPGQADLGGNPVTENLQLGRNN